MMNRIVFALLSFVAFVELIDGQSILTPCQRAEQELANDQICANASRDGNNATIVCSERCNSLYQAVIGVCGGTTVSR